VRAPHDLPVPLSTALLAGVELQNVVPPTVKQGREFKFGRKIIVEKPFSAIHVKRFWYIEFA
jgi:hypothetical protein